MKQSACLSALVACVVCIASSCGDSSNGSSSDFYTPPDALPSDVPGTLIRAEAMEPFAEGTQAWRVLYVSESVEGAPIAVSGMVAAPAGPAPEGGYDVVTWGHGTTGVSDRCAPSRGYRTGFHDFYDVAPELVGAGYVGVATDYEGLGTPGMHAYLVGPSQGRGMLDIVKAAQQIEEASAGSRVVAWGASQGGHAACFTGEIAPTWAPELELLGVIASAPGAEIKGNIEVMATLRIGRGFVWQLGLGYGAAYEELSIEDIFPADALAIIEQLLEDEACGDEFSEVGAADSGPGFTTSPLQIESWEARLDASTQGLVRTEVPVLLLQGTDDTIAPIVLANRLYERYCDIGNQTDYRVFEGYDHDDASRQNMLLMLEWTAARFAGEPAATTCK